MMVNNNLLGVFSPPTPLKNDGVKVSWVDEIPKFPTEWNKKFMFQSPPTRGDSISRAGGLGNHWAS